MQTVEANSRSKSQVIILQTARSLVTKNRSYDLSIREIAKLAGYSYGTLYKYYKNSELLKEDLFNFQLELLRIQLQDIIADKLLRQEPSLVLVKSAVSLCLQYPDGEVILDLLRLETKKYQLLNLAKELEKLFSFLDQKCPAVPRERWFSFFSELAFELMLAHSARI